ncbi:Telomerase ribonucleoprotein complex - RNA binding domain containing protein [Lactarius tabidus]
MSSQRSTSFPKTSLEPSCLSTGGSKCKPRFAEFACSFVEIFRFAAVVTKAVIPMSFWGGDENFRVVMSALKNFISYRRYESMSLHEIMRGLSTLNCKWTAPGNTSTTHIPISDNLKRRELLEEFIVWYFGSFVAPLLRTTFYITESSAFKNKILYFRQDDWDVLCRPLVERLTSVTFSKLEESEAEEILRQRKLGFSFVRLLPKDTGVRPIVNLRRKRAETQGKTNTRQQSINDILQAAFQILTYEKTTRPELAFKTRLIAASPSRCL